MPLVLDWQHVALRLALTVLAGLAVGFNRGEHGRPAGMRTTLLVCLAASISMIQANLLLATAGRANDSFIMMDLMRLPLGILSGMGFIGAGAILRKDDLVLGVTTAATLWFTTVMGLCFGGGQLGLGIAATVLGIGTLWGLKYVEMLIKREVRGTLSLTVSANGPSDDEIRASIAQDACEIIFWSIEYSAQGARRIVQAELERREMPGDTAPPRFVGEFARNASIQNVKWQPQGMSKDPPRRDSQPMGTPIPITVPD